MCFTRSLVGTSYPAEDTHINERLQVVAERLRNRTAVDEDAGLHVLEGIARETRARDEGSRAVDHRDLRVDLAVDERLGLSLRVKSSADATRARMIPAGLSGPRVLNRPR